MNQNNEEEMKCPICSKTIWSDATIHEYCKLCGMGITEPSTAPRIKTKEGTSYFCCEKCCKIYKEKIPKK
jgi:uncharacterized C2H2 Zn-finger protein